MTIKARSISIDDVIPDRYYFQVYGPDSAKGTVRLAALMKDLPGSTPGQWIADNQAEAQAAIDGGRVAQPFTARQEARDFASRHPNALLLIKLAPNDLEAAIDNRTAAQETLLLKALAYVARVWFAERTAE